MQFIIDLQLFNFFSKFFNKKGQGGKKKKQNKNEKQFWKNSYLVYFLRMDYSREFCSLQLVSRRIIDKRFMAVYFSAVRYFFFHKKLLISVNKIFFSQKYLQEMFDLWKQKSIIMSSMFFLFLFFFFKKKYCTYFCFVLI